MSETTRWIPLVPKDGDIRPSVYQWRYKGENDSEWQTGTLMGTKFDNSSCQNGEYRVPEPPEPPAPINDICLVWLAGTIATVSKQFPGAADGLRVKWLKVKAEATAEMVEAIERVRNGGSA